jgi:outer membrane lipoprotein-sorting protein
MNILRRLPLSRLLLLCSLVLAIGVSATALAFAIGAGPTPAPKPLAQAVHDALLGAHEKPIEGVSANVTLTNNLLEGANLADGQGGGLSSNPLLTGASGRLWIAKDGRMRLELQSQQGDTQILYDGHKVELYDAATNTLYRYTPPAPEGSDESDSRQHEEVPSVAKIEEGISHLSQHADVSPATPANVAGQPAYTVRISPKEGGSLFAGVELSFDADRGVPLRAAVYSTTSSAPAFEIAASEISYAPVAGSVFEINPPRNAKVEEVTLPHPKAHEAGKPDEGGEKPKLTTHGDGPGTIAVLASSRNGEAKVSGGKGDSQVPEGLPKVSINGTPASELRTELGTILSFERGGVHYLLAGSVAPAAIEAVARGL